MFQANRMHTGEWSAVMPDMALSNISYGKDWNGENVGKYK
jgi:hypothetical protein